jgi:hypothetical protein
MDIDFLTDSMIDEMAAKALLDKSRCPGFGMRTNYFFVEPNSICGVPVRLFDMREGPDGSAGPFYVDLAVETSVKGFYTILENRFVVSLTLEFDNSGKNEVAFVEEQESAKIIETLGGICPDKPKPTLTLVKK